MPLLRLVLICVALFQPVPQLQAQSAAHASTEPTISSYRLDPPLLEKAQALHRIRVARFVTYLIYTPLLLFLILRLRAAARFRELAENVSRFRVVQSFAFTSLLLAVLGLLSFPLDAHGHSIALRYGLSVQGWTSWLWDACKSLLMNIAVASFLVWGFYALLHRHPRDWWFFAWLSAMPIAVFLVFVAPVIVDPVFNHYDPLAEKQPELTRAIRAVVQRGGLAIPESRMFEMHASEKVTTYNAYVTGIGATKRIVVWDTTARDLSTAETLFIFGHEMGHYVLHHIWKGLALLALGLFVGLWLTARICRRLLPRLSSRCGLRDSADLASLPLLLLIGFVLSFLSQPIQSAFSRHLEHQADVYGLEVTHGLVPNSSSAAAASFQKLGENSLSIPDPNRLLVFWTYSHPPIADRLRFALEYRPWDQGRVGQFFK